MSRQYLNPDELFDSLQYGFSQGVVVEGGRTIYLSGQVGWDAGQAMTGAGDLRAQTWQALRNVQTALAAGGATLDDVVSLRIYIVQEQLDNGAVISEALKQFFGEGHAPASTWIGVPGLANKDFLIEIEAIAQVGA